MPFGSNEADRHAVVGFDQSPEFVVSVICSPAFNSSVFLSPILSLEGLK
jgi:hypothetical protein